MWRSKIVSVGLVILLAAMPALAMSTGQEIAIGREAASQFEAENGWVRDIAMQNRLDRIGRRLLGHAERGDLPWRFRVVNVNEFNAAAFPGGFIYATRGLMNGLSDDQLAFVIAHEIGHVGRRRTVKQIEKLR